MAKDREEKTAKVRLNEKRRMSFKEKREFEQLEQEIAALEAEKQSIEEALCSGTLSVDELTEKSKRLPELAELIDEKTMRWLESKRNRIELRKHFDFYRLFYEVRK